MKLKDHPDALDCTLYRPDENDPDAEELELGDGHVLFEGAFEAPAHASSASTRACSPTARACQSTGFALAGLTSSMCPNLAATHPWFQLQSLTPRAQP